MSRQECRSTKPSLTIEARRLVELARAAGLGDSPDDAIEWHHQALALLGTDEETPLFADVLRWQGSVLRDCGRTSDAEPLYRRSLEISTRLGYDAGRAHALNCLAALAQRRGDIAMAANLLNDALTLATCCGETRLIGMMQQNLGIIADIRGDTAAALSHYGVSLQSFESTNDLQPLCWVLTNLGVLHVKERRYEAARVAFERALGISRARGDLMTEGIVEQNRAELDLMRGAIEDAYAPLTRAFEVADQRGDNLGRAAALKLRGAYERLTGRPTEATDTLRRALTLSAVAEDALLGAEVLYQFGMALHDAGDLENAHEVWTAALEAFERIAAAEWVARTRQRLTAGPTGRYL